MNSVGRTAYTGFHSSDKPGCDKRFPNPHILLPSPRTHISWLPSAAAAPLRSTIRLPHRLIAKGQTIHVTKDIQVLATANSSSIFSSKITTGGDKTLPGRSRGYGPWQHNSLLAVVFTCAALTQVPFCCICPFKRQGEMATKTSRCKRNRKATKYGFQAGFLWHRKKPVEFLHLSLGPNQKHNSLI